MSSVFDPNVFLDAQQTEVNEKRATIPAENPASPDGLYLAIIGEVKMAAGTISKGERIGQAWMQAVVPLKLQLPPEVQALGLPSEFQLTDRPMIDLTPGSVCLPDGSIQGSIDNSKGKNNAQRIYREATGLNKKGEAFAWRMTQGKPVKVRLTHEIYLGNTVEKVANVFPV